jgi:hypothetical protein
MDLGFHAANGNKRSGPIMAGFSTHPSKKMPIAPIAAKRRTEAPPSDAAAIKEAIAERNVEYVVQKQKADTDSLLNAVAVLRNEISQDKDAQDKQLRSMHDDMLSVRGTALKNVRGFYAKRPFEALEAHKKESVDLEDIYSAGEELLLMYPMQTVKDTVVMRVRKVDPDTAQLMTGWIVLSDEAGTCVGSFRV